MSEQPTSDECAARGTVCYQEGTVEDARRWFQYAIKLDKHNQTAWLWLSHCYPDQPENRVRCLTNAVKLGPQSPDGQEASRLLAGLQAEDAPPPAAEESPAPTEPTPPAPPDTAQPPVADENAVRARGLERLAAQECITEQMAFRVFQRISAEQAVKLNDVVRRYLNGELAHDGIAAKVAQVQRAAPASKAAPPAPSDTAQPPAMDEKALRAAGLERLATQEHITEQMAFSVLQRISAKQKTKLDEVARRYLDGKLAHEQVAAEIAHVQRTAPASKAAPLAQPDTAQPPAMDEKALRARGLERLATQEYITEQMAFSVFQRISAKQKTKLDEVVRRYLDRQLAHEQVAAEVAHVQREALATKAVGEHVSGKVVKIVSFGAFVDLGVGIKSLAHISELGEQGVTASGDSVQVGKTYTFKIISIDEERLHIGLSLRQAKAAACPNDSGGQEHEHLPLHASGWLKDHGVVVQESRQPADHDAIWDELALEMGDNFLHLEHLLRRMRQQTSKKDNNEFVINLNNASPEQREAVKHFCNRLHSEYAFLRRYYFHKDTQIIRLAVNLEAMSTHAPFFNGYWFERYVVVRMKNLLEPRHTPYDYLLNAHIQWPDGRQNELDVFFLIDAQPLWIECRSGQVADQIERYAAIRRQLGVPRERAVVLGLTVTDKATATMTQVHDVTVANLTTFPQHVQAMLS
jgi:predicted RNA-binding protein with RPS1 domain